MPWDGAPASSWGRPGSPSTTSTIPSGFTRSKAAFRSSNENGLRSTARAPSSMACCNSASTLNAVIITTLADGFNLEICKKHSTPFRPGIFTSTNVRSNSWLRNRSRAASPSWAVVTWWPRPSMTSTRLSARSRSSSTTSILSGRKIRAPNTLHKARHRPVSADGLQYPSSPPCGTAAPTR